MHCPQGTVALLAYNLVGGRGGAEPDEEEEGDSSRSTDVQDATGPGRKKKKVEFWLVLWVLWRGPTARTSTSDASNPHAHCDPRRVGLYRASA